MKIRSFAFRISVPAAMLLSALVVGLSGCGKDKTPATQVAAKVNGAEISVHQLNDALTHVPGITPETADQARREVLDKLIDQQLAVEQAQAKKLDRSPEVVGAVEAAKREILARAYLDQVVAGLPKPAVEEAKTYYAAQPQLFAQRRVYNLQEIVLPTQGAPVDKLREMANGKSMDDIANWLKQQNIRFSANATTRSAEQLPLDMLPKLHELKDGQSAVFVTPQAVSVVRIAASQFVPINEVTAVPRIQQFLANQRAGSAVTADIKQLKEKAKIEIVASFDAKADTPQAAKTEAATPPSPIAPNVEKGVAGLK